MIPETGQNGTVELFRATAFPWAWQLEKVLYRAPGLDTTLHVEQGTYWFFTTFLDPAGASNQLCLFNAPSLTADWRFHPQNPIAKDVRQARGAGKLFRTGEGALIRPCQDNSVRYGYALRFMEILKLNTAEYKEQLFSTILPEEKTGQLGLHTYNRVSEFEVLDGVRAEPRNKIT
jgi:hypothetical protein